MLKLKGHSGCSVILKEKNNSRTVIKSTNDKSYISRLASQSKKQQNFNFFEGIYSPKVILETKHHDQFSFEMEYIWGKDFISFTCESDKLALDKIAFQLIEFINYNLKHSSWCDFPISEFKNKVADTLEIVRSKNLVDKALMLRAEKAFMNFEYSEKFPIGYCHGDLTFSNIIVDNKNKKLAFIDFLDVKINSPIQDIIKLRQDTRYFWTLNLFDGQTDSNKIKISWAYIDSIICSNLIKNSKIEQYYSIMQLLNFFRILKYTSDDYLVNFVVDCIKDVMEEL